MTEIECVCEIEGEMLAAEPKICEATETPQKRFSRRAKMH